MNPFKWILWWFWNTKREWIAHAMIEDACDELAAREFVREYIVTPQMLDDIEGFLRDASDDNPETK